MAKLDTDDRNRLSASTFGLPGRRAYPMPDRSHAANAKARATQQYNAGNLSAADRATIDRKANAKLGQSPGGYVPNPAMNPGQAHPRMHALTMAAATHLHNAGHLPAPQAAQIKAKAKSAMNRMKAQGSAAQPQAPMFGSLAPVTPQVPPTFSPLGQGQP